MKRTALAALAVLLLPAPAQAAPDPFLPPGDAPETAYQTGPTVVFPTGKSVTLPGTLKRAQVLGQRHGEWIAWVDGGEPEVFAVKGSKVRKLWHHTYDESATGYSLVDGADQVVEWNYGRGGEVFGTVFDLRGKALGTRYFPGSASLLDADADGLLIGTRKQTLRWVPGQKPVPAGPAAYFADIEQDLLMVPVGDDALGPTSLSAPGVPPWSWQFAPVVVSPDGAWVAGVSFNRRPRLVVLHLADGVLAPVPGLLVDSGATIPGGPYVQMTWEPDGDLLFVTRGTKGRAVVRCTVTGACERATAFVKGPAVSFPS